MSSHNTDSVVADSESLQRVGVYSASSRICLNGSAPDISLLS